MVRSLALAVLVSLSSVASAAPRVRVIAPDTLRSDSNTTLELQPADLPLEGLTVAANAGTAGKPRRDGDRLVVDYTPPHVAIDRTVELSVRSHGRTVGIGTMKINAVPPAIAEQWSKGPLGLRGPSMLILGAETPAVITLATNAHVELAVNVGSIAAPTRGSDGSWHAVYIPPTQRFPQVAIVTVLADNGAVDWLRIPLYGVGRVDTKTRPNSEITLAISGMTFGPFRTDARGAATNPVIAPPGIHHGITRTVDSAGNAKDTPFDLGTPPFLRLAGRCTGESIRLFVVGPDGAAAADAKPLLTVAHGALGALTPLGPGEWQARWLPGPTDVSDEVRARVDDVRSTVCTVSAPSDPPASLELRIGGEPRSRYDYVAGRGAFTITAVLGYRGPRPPQIVPVELSSELGPIEVTSRGTTTIGVVHPQDHFAGRTTATIRARVPSSLLTASIEVTLRPGRVAHLALKGPQSLETNGATVPISVAAEDAFGNTATVPKMVATADGRLAPSSSAGFTYSAPHTSRWSDHVTVRDPVTGTSATLVVGLHRPPTRFLIAARVGYLTNFGKISAPLVLVDAAYRLPWLRRRLSLGIEAGFYQGDRQEQHDDVRLALTFIGIPILARIGYTVPFGRVALYGGVGGGVMVARISSTTDKEIDISLGALGLFGAHLGLDFDVHVGRILVEAGYFYAPSNLHDVSGNLGGLSATAGYRVNL